MVKIFTILVVLKWNASEWNIKQIGTITKLIVAVPGRNRTLFRFVFRSHYCARSALAQNFG